MNDTAHRLAAAYLKMLNEHDPDLVDTFVARDYRNLVVAGDRAVGRFVYRGTQSGELMGLPATGRRIEMRSIDIWRVAGARFVEHWDELDTFAVFQQIGALPLAGVR